MFTQNELELIYNGDRLDEVLEILDDLHTAASDKTLKTYTTMTRHELVAMLRDVIYTAQEAISEIEQDTKQAKRDGEKTAPTNIVPFQLKDSVQERHA